MRLRRVWVLTLEISTLSINIRPDSGFMIASSDSASVLFPEPVLPSSAVVDPAGIRKEMLERDGSR